jgi:hypothetical protein
MSADVRENKRLAVIDRRYSAIFQTFVGTGYASAAKTLYHRDPSPRAREPNAIHGVPNHEESASMGGKQALCLGGIRDFLGIEARAFILDHQQHASIGLAEASHLNLLGWVLPVPMNNRVGERLSQSQFDLREMAFSTLHFTCQRHDILDDTFDRLQGGGNGLA